MTDEELARRNDLLWLAVVLTLVCASLSLRNWLEVTREPEQVQRGS